MATAKKPAAGAKKASPAKSKSSAAGSGRATARGRGAGAAAERPGDDVDVVRAGEHGDQGRVSRHERQLRLEDVRQHVIAAVLRR